MRRFFVEPSSVGDRHIAVREPADRNHIKNVLRMTVGDEAMLSDGTSFEYRTRIAEILPDGIIFEILDKQELASEPSINITLFQGMPKQGKLETIIQKSVELGVHAIVPVHTARSVPRGNIGNSILKRERWKRVAGEAGKQSRRGIIPEVENPITIGEAIERLSEFDAILFPYENEENITLKEVLVPIANAFKAPSKASANGGSANEAIASGGIASESIASGGIASESGASGAIANEAVANHAVANVAVFIGPEGGMTDEEVVALTDAGAKRCSLGKRILRTETAGPAVIAMIMYEWDL